MTTITPATLASELAAATPPLSDDEQRLFLTLYRLLAARRARRPDRSRRCGRAAARHGQRRARPISRRVRR